MAILDDLKKNISSGAQRLRTTVGNIVPQVSRGVRAAAKSDLERRTAPYRTVAKYLELDKPAVTPETRIPLSGGQTFGATAPVVDPVARTVRGGIHALNVIPSYMTGGVLKASRESLTGNYEAPKIGPDFRLGRTPDANIGDFIHPTLVGAYRGVTQKQELFDEAPKTLGLQEGTLPYFAVGLGAEILSPDPADLRLFGKGDEAAKVIDKAFSKVPEELQSYARIAGESPSYNKFVDNVMDRLAVDPGALGAMENKSLREFYNESSKIYDNAVKQIQKLPAKTGKVAGRTEQVAARMGDDVAEVVNPLQKSVPGSGGSVLDELAADRAYAEELKKQAGKGTGFAASFKSRFLDRFDVAKDIDEDFYMNMRNVAGGGSARAEEIVTSGVAPALSREFKAGRLDDFSSYLTLKRMEELVGTRGFERSLDMEKINKGLQELVQKYGPEGVREMEQSAQQLRGFLDETLTMLQKSGIISEDTAQAARAANKQYITFETIGQMVRQIDEPGEAWVKNSFNVAQQNVFKKIGSSQSGVGDPIQSTIEKLMRTIDVADKNSIVRKFVNTNADNNNVLIKLAEGENAPTGWGKINFFEDGVKQTYAVPKLLEAAIKNLDSEPMHWALRAASVPTTILKKSTVQYNPAFWVVNPARDIQDALVSEGATVGIPEATRMLGNYAETFSRAIGKDEAWQAWRRAGGAQSTFVAEEVFNQNTKAAVDKIIRGSADVEFEVKTWKDAATKANDFFENMLRVPEESTRLAKFRNAATNVDIKAAQEIVPYADLPRSLREAAFESRNITLDFAKAGSVSRVLNQLIPFFNVGVQGTARLAELAAKDPIQFSKSIAVFVGVPTLIMHLHNNRFEDYGSIAQFEKDNNWIIMLGDRTPEQAANGESIKAIKIPKGNIVLPFANITDNFLSELRRTDPQGWQELALNTAENISPVGIPGPDGRTSRFLGNTIFGIQAIKPFYEWYANKNIYTGFNIVPQSMQGIDPKEQYDENTSMLARGLGAAADYIPGVDGGLSPKQIDNLIGTGGGTVIRALSQLPSLERARQSTIGRFTEPREDTNEGYQYEAIQDVRQDAATESFVRKREAKLVLEEIADNPENRAEILKRVANSDRELFLKVREEINDQRTGLSKADQSLKALPVDARANYILNETAKLPANERTQFLADMSRKKIMTPDVRARMARIMQEEQSFGGEPGGIFQQIMDFFGNLVPEVGAAGLTQTGEAEVENAGRGIPEDGLDPVQNRLIAYTYDSVTGEFKDQWGFTGPLQGDQVELGANSYLYTYTKKGDTFVDEFGNPLPLLEADKKAPSKSRLVAKSGKKIKYPASLKTVASKTPRQLRKTKVKPVDLGKGGAVQTTSPSQRRSLIRARRLDSSDIKLPAIRKIDVDFPKIPQNRVLPINELKI